jgi:hypothetical protein
MVRNSNPKNSDEFFFKLITLDFSSLVSKCKRIIVALSFAGEDREYVEKVAEYLKAKSVRVFYDNYEKPTLWGKDLYTHLQEIYYQEAKYTIMFVSSYYAQKLWTNHERKNAQARAFQENKVYILPARFDDTEIPWFS